MILAMSRIWHIDPVLLTMLVGTVIPLVSHFVTAEKAPEQLKWGIITGLSCIGGGLAPLLTQGNTGLDPHVFLVSIATTFGSAVVAHLGLVDPLKIGTALHDVGPQLGDTQPQAAPVQSFPEFTGVTVVQVPVTQNMLDAAVQELKNEITTNRLGILKISANLNDPARTAVRPRRTSTSKKA